MRTFPMRARKSQSSKSYKTTTGLGISLDHMKHTAKVERRTYIFSVGLFIFTIVGLVVGTVGQFGEQALARENNRSYNNGRTDRTQRTYTWTTTNKSNGSSNNANRQTTAAPKSNTPATNSPSNTNRQTPSQTTSRTPSAPTNTTNTTQNTSQQTSASTQTAQQSVVPRATTTVRSTPTASTPADTEAAASEAAAVSAASKTMSATKAADTSAPVTYTSQQISKETRNRILALAVSAATSGTIIYLMSLFAANNGTGAMEARYRVRGREVITR